MLRTLSFETQDRHLSSERHQSRYHVIMHHYGRGRGLPGCSSHSLAAWPLQLCTGGRRLPGSSAARQRQAATGLGRYITPYKIATLLSVYD